MISAILRRDAFKFIYAVADTVETIREIVKVAFDGHVRAHRAVGRKIAHVQKNYTTFTQGEIGKWTVLNARLWVGEACGSQVGYMFPEATLSYAVGSHVAKAASRTFYEAQMVGAVCFVAATFFSGSGLLVTYAAMITGGYEGRELLRVREWSQDPKNLLETYPVKKTQSLAAQTIVFGARCVLGRGSALESLAGYCIQSATGLAAYNGLYFYQALTQKHDTKAVIESLDPAHLLKMVIRKTYGTEKQFIDQVCLDEQGVPQIPAPVRAKIAEYLADETGVRALVRTVNACTEAPENRLFQFAEAHVSRLVTQLLRALKKMEIRKTGFVLSDLRQNQRYLERMAARFIPLFLKNILQSQEPLTQEEISAFYQHMHALLHANYGQYAPFRMVSARCLTYLPHVLQSERLAPLALDRGLNTLEKPPIKPVTPSRLDRVLAIVWTAFKVAFIAIFAFFVGRKLLATYNQRFTS